MAEEGYWQIAGRGWWRTWCTYLYVAVATAVIVNLYIFIISSLILFSCVISNVCLQSFQVDVSNFDNDRKFVSTNNRVGSNYSFFPQRQDLPHEMDTTNVADGMLMVYFWGKSNDVENNYRHNTDVKSGSTVTQVGLGSESCGNERRIPAYEEGVTVTINTNNC